MSGLPVLAHVVSILCAVLLVVFFVVSVGFKIPQLLGSRYCEKFGYSTIGLLRVLMGAFAPLGFLIQRFSHLISKLFGADPAKTQEEITEEEIRMLVDVGNEIGFIEESQKEMINNIFEFDDTTAGEVMTHRTEMIAVEKNAKISEIDRQMEKLIKTRYILSEMKSQTESCEQLKGGEIFLTECEDCLLYTSPISQ